VILCLYCEQESFQQGKGSKEHAILSALGGRKISRNVCCERCNRKLGNEIDEPLTKDFSFFTTMLGITTGRDKQAATHKRAVTFGGKAYNLKPTGNFELSKAEVEISEENGEVNIAFDAKDERQAIKILEQTLARYGLSPKDFESLPAKEVRYPAPKMTQAIKLGGEAQGRSIAKMMLTYLATMLSPQRLRGSSFDPFIAYIKGDQASYEFLSYDFTTLLPETPRFGAGNHRLFTFASGEARKVVSVLELFGHLRWSAILTDLWNVPNMGKVYVVNPVTKEQAELSIQLAFDSFDFNYPRYTVSQNIEDAIKGIGKVIQEHQLNYRRLEIIQTALDRHIKSKTGEPKSLITEAMVSEIADKVVEEFMKLVMHQASEETIDLKHFL
jgi:hypothetical protein